MCGKRLHGGVRDCVSRGRQPREAALPVGTRARSARTEQAGTFGKAPRTKGP